ncbi:MAG: folylpolyglutamate synthase/dihydrofolate synthase family protein [Termitinemataceae bacterium]|nr:MAG: folylpolyglutamate synthase/dihydrofolate synthase family protein [Termitinemataceae bacterium]
MTGKTFTSAQDVFNWLGRFVNLEQGVKPPSMRPERMRVIADEAGNPENCAPAFHVAGSKGKGSITVMASAILEKAGFRVARYLSPHITEYRERITLNNNFFDEEIYISAGETLRKVQKKLESSPELQPEPTFFELLTLYYFLCAKYADCNALAVETGMGGRLDPTNIAQSRVTVITGIELEHTDMLGNTIAQIAFEKAGIIKNKIPLILAAQTHTDGADALNLFKKTAAERSAPFFYFPEIAFIDNVKVSQQGTSWTLCPLTKDFFDSPVELEISLIGEIQAINTSLALLAMRKGWPEIQTSLMQNAVRQIRLPARFETLLSQPAVIVDGAHTAISISLCAKTWKTLYGEGGILIFGCAQGKDASAMARSLAPLFSRVIITTPGTFKVSDPENVFTAFCESAPELARSGGIEFIKDTAAGIKTALDYARDLNLPVLGTGSFYLAAEIREFVSRYSK